jgi:hypothetical protein
MNKRVLSIKIKIKVHYYKDKILKILKFFLGGEVGKEVNFRGFLFFSGEPET